MIEPVPRGWRLAARDAIQRDFVLVRSFSQRFPGYAPAEDVREELRGLVVRIDVVPTPFWIGRVYYSRTNGRRDLLVWHQRHATREDAVALTTAEMSRFEAAVQLGWEPS